MEKDLQEVFVLPVGLKKVASMDGEDFYGSDKLNQKFIKAMEKSGKTKPIAGKLSELINKGKINPVYYERGFFKFAAWKIFAPMNQRFTSAFYTGSKRKIYVILSNKANLFAVVPNNAVADILLHELMHMVAHSNNAAFLNIWMEDLIKYYRSVFSNLLQLKEEDISNDFLKKYITKLSKAFDGTYGKGSYKSVIMNSIKELMTLSSKSNLEQERYRQLVYVYKNLGTMIVFNSKKWANNIQRFAPFINLLEQSYMSLGLRSIDVICSQEILIPSEVAAVCSSHPKFLKKAHATVKKL